MEIEEVVGNKGKTLIPPLPEPHPYPLSKGRGGFWGRGVVSDWIYKGKK